MVLNLGNRTLIMKTFLCVVAAVVMTILVCIPIHFSWSKHIRADREKAEENPEECRKEKHKVSGELADKNRVPKWAPSKYKFLKEKGEKRK